MTPFKVIVADPPWPFNDKLPGEGRGAAKHYPLMTTYDICQLAVKGHGSVTIMDQPIADDAVLFLWRVASMQQSALDVAQAWGFVVKTDLVWLKKTSTGQRWFGMGRTLRAEHETCLVCTRGRPELLNRSTRSTFVTDLDLNGLSAKVGRHSEKPSEFYSIVESLVAGPYLELFARRERTGWTTIGNEIGEACSS
jgi:N6-adenosine-specific RNA methylase IME4